MADFTIHVHSDHHEALAAEISKLPQVKLNSDGVSGTIANPDDPGGEAISFKLEGEEIQFTLPAGVKDQAADIRNRLVDEITRLIPA